jgi:hypothetical protein
VWNIYQEGVRLLTSKKGAVNRVPWKCREGTCTTSSRAPSCTSGATPTPRDNIFGSTPSLVARPSTPTTPGYVCNGVNNTILNVLVDAILPSSLFLFCSCCLDDMQNPRVEAFCSVGSLVKGFETEVLRQGFGVSSTYKKGLTHSACVCMSDT